MSFPKQGYSQGRVSSAETRRTSFERSHARSGGSNDNFMEGALIGAAVGYVIGTDDAPVSCEGGGGDFGGGGASGEF